MAMNEDSVVSSLNELRRMANDRARRETETRSRADDRSGWDQRGNGRRADGRARTTEIRGSAGQPDAMGPAGSTLMGGFAGPAPQQGWGPPEGAPNQGGFGAFPGYGFAQPGQSPMVAEPPREPLRQKSAVGPVLLTILILGGAAGGGYWKLQQDFQATLRARDAALVEAEQARDKAVEAASRAEQKAKLALAEAEQHRSGVSAEKPAASDPTPAAAAAAPSAPAAKAVAAAKPAKAEKAEKAEKGKHARAARPAAHKVAARPAAAPPASAEAKKPTNLPKIAGKKKVSDDPLAGLKL